MKAKLKKIIDYQRVTTFQKKLSVVSAILKKRLIYDYTKLKYKKQCPN